MKIRKSKVDPMELKDFDKEKSLKLFEDNTLHVIVVPYNGKPIPVVVMILNSVQIKACGNPGMIKIKEDGKKSDAEYTIEQMIQVKNTQEKILSTALVSPTFDEINKIAENTDHISKIRSDINKAKKLLEETEPKTSSERVEQRKLLRELEAKEILISFLLPDDFMAYVTSFVLQAESSDIQKVTEDMLLESAILAERYKNPPHTFMSGVFTDYQKSEIDKSAIVIYQRFKEQKELEKKGTKVIGGPKRK